MCDMPTASAVQSDLVTLKELRHEYSLTQRPRHDRVIIQAPIGLRHPGEANG
jgi:hypothetical protein